MKKKIISSALILTMLFGFSLNAQTVTENTNCTKAEKCDKPGKADCDKAKCDKPGKAKAGKMHPRNCNPFEGIDLTEQQKAQLEAICPMKAKMDGCQKPECDKAAKADCKKADCKKADCKKADCKKADCDKAKCDKAKCDKPGKGNHPKARRPELNPEKRSEFIGKVKEILTPEQYVKFLENMALNRR